MPNTSVLVLSMNWSRQFDITAMYFFGSIAIRRSRVCGLAAMRSWYCSVAQTAAMPPSWAALMNMP